MEASQILIQSMPL